jgi:hypothetical protein
MTTTKDNMTQSSSTAALPNLSFVSDHTHPVAADVFMTYFAAQVHLAFNNDLRPSPNRIIEVSRRLGITRQQCLLLLKSGKFPASPLVSFPKLTTDADYHQHPLASPDDYCVVAVSNVIEKIKEFPEAKKDVFDKLPEMLLAFDQTLSSAPLTDKPFWSYKGIALFLRSFFLEDHVTTSAGGLVGVAAKGSRRAGCSVQLTRS